MREDSNGGKKRHSKGKGCWYHTTIYACVLCGRENIYRTREWGRRPRKNDWSKRYEYHETACASHFM